LNEVAVAFFIKIDGITGQHKGEIQLESWSWGVTNAGSAMVGSGQVLAQDFSFTSVIGSQSPLIFKACVTGEKHSATLTISGGSASGKESGLLQINFTNIIFSGYKEMSLTKPDGSTSATPMEQVSFNFAKIEVVGFGQDVFFDATLNKLG
jgi:type VI secretion system secreted protein Hcp